MSTATERVFRQRGDFKVHHEPFLVYYYLHRSERSMPMLDEFTQPKDYDDIRSELIGDGERGPVFFKDMAYSAMPRVLDDPSFLKRLHHIFLIRDPRRSIASYHRLDPGVTRAEIGLEHQWTLLRHLHDELRVKALVVEAERIAAQPQIMVKRICDYVGIGFNEASLQWPANDMPKDWRYVEGWHADAGSSTQLKPDHRDAQAVFDRASEKAPHLRDYLAYHEEFYRLLKAAAADEV